MLLLWTAMADGARRRPVEGTAGAVQTKGAVELHWHSDADPSSWSMIVSFLL